MPALLGRADDHAPLAPLAPLAPPTPPTSPLALPRPRPADGASDVRRHAGTSGGAEGPPGAAGGLDAGRLRELLETGALVVHYQPVLDLRTGQVVAVEALARLRVDGAVLAPAAFLPLAEACGLLGRVDDLVLQSAVSACAAWRARRPGRPLSVGVNVTFADLRPGYAEHVTAVCAAAGLTLDALVVEVTETGLMDDPDAHVAVLTRLAAAGVNVTLDDFGTGFSSLTHLHDLPVAGIKVDRGFVAELGGPGRGAAITRSLVALARDLGVHVVAEGVETTAQATALQEMGCPYAQGYLYSRPLPGAALTAWLAAAG